MRPSYALPQEKAVAVGDDSSPTTARCDRPRPIAPAIVTCGGDRGRPVPTTTAVTTMTVTDDQRQITVRPSGVLVAVRKMRSSPVVTSSATTTVLVALTATAVLSLLLSARPVNAIGQLQGQYSGPYPDICPRWELFVFSLLLYYEITTTWVRSVLLFVLVNRIYAIIIDSKTMLWSFVKLPRQNSIAIYDV